VVWGCCTVVWTHARQVLYHLSHASCPFYFIFQVSIHFCPCWPQPIILLPLPPV
jgi:hypothetical protein